MRRDHLKEMRKEKVIMAALKRLPSSQKTRWDNRGSAGKEQYAKSSRILK